MLISKLYRQMYANAGSQPIAHARTDPLDGRDGWQGHAIACSWPILHRTRDKDRRTEDSRYIDLKNALSLPAALPRRRCLVL